MMYIPKTRLEEFRRGIEAWKQFKQLSQQLARHNAQTLKQKGVLHPKTLQGASRRLKPVSSDNAPPPCVRSTAHPDDP